MDSVDGACEAAVKLAGHRRTTTMSQLTPIDNINGHPNSAMLLGHLLKTMLGPDALANMSTADKENIRDMFNESLGSSSTVSKKQRMNNGLLSFDFLF